MAKSIRKNRSDDPQWVRQLVVLSLMAVAPLTAFGQKVPLSSEVLQWTPPSFMRQGQSASARVTVFLELEGSPTTEIYLKTFRSSKGAGETDAQASKAANAGAVKALREVLEEQGVFQKTLEKSGLESRVLFSTGRVANGFVAEVPWSEMWRLQEMDGLKRVLPLPPHELETSTSVPFTRFPEAWSSEMSGLLGEGIRLGIADTGIDYLHRDFGGPGSPQDYQQNDPTTNADGFFPTAKVVGGIDFAGDSYDPRDSEHSVPVPDPDPLDCNGHGTHVAGIASGLGVLANNTTYTGVYGNSTAFESFKIGPGAAPGADLYAIKIFGCEGPTFLTLQAIEWAVDPNEDGDFSDRLDVLNMSLGSSYGSGEDPSASAASLATEIGTVVVASAGNSGDDFYVTSTPAAGPGVISVAGVQDDGLLSPRLLVTSPSEVAGAYTAGVANFGPLLDTAGVSGSLVEAEPVLACSTLTNSAQLNGKIALIDRGECPFSDKVRAAQMAGAIAAVVVNNVTGVVPGSMSPSGDTSDILIPSLHISFETGDSLRSLLDDGVTVTLLNAPTGDTIYTNSSRGPAHSDSRIHLKPDLVAPGVRILSAGRGTGTEGVLFNGTSMSAPHVAGAMALLREKHPSWTPAELKALVMNTANHDVFQEVLSSPPRYGTGRVGAGRLDATTMLQSEVIAFDADFPEEVGLSFGFIEAFQPLAVTKTVSIRNKGTTSWTFLASYDALTPVPGVEISFPDGNEWEVPAGSSVQKRVLLSIPNPSLLPHSREGTVASVQSFPRYWLTEETGKVVLTPTVPGTPLRVPLHAAVRPATLRTVAEETFNFGGALTGVSSLSIQGDPLLPIAEPPMGYRGLTAGFEWKLEDPAEFDSDFRSAMADLRLVGIASDWMPGLEIEQAMVYFAVVSNREWASPNELTFFISVDTDEDGDFDYDLASVNLGTVTNQGSDDAFAAISFPRGNGADGPAHPLNGIPPETLDTAAFNNQIMILPVRAGDIGLSQENSDFEFVAVTTLGGSGVVADITERAHHNLARPGLNFVGPMAGDLYLEDSASNQTLSFQYDLSALAENDSLGGLILFPFNAEGFRAVAIGTTAATTDLQVVLSAIPATAIPGSPLIYRLAHRNGGPAQVASGVILEGFLPPGVTFLSASPDCVHSAGVVTCPRGAVPAGGVRSVTVEVAVPADYAAPLVSFAAIRGQEFDPDLRSNFSRLVTPLLGLPTPTPTNQGNGEATPTPLPEDINEDGTVDDLDLLRLLHKWRHSN